ncbi:MAG: M42 family metallopeptidase [Defluviitaleaceae bacterium]|jgi:putative aminopeptidase FrvX|nr:M42 family metallopeptidase [Defluviitaleaceae bacterium]
MKVDREYILSSAKALLTIDSPTGFTNNAMTKVEEVVKELGLTFVRNNKGAGMVRYPGKNNGKLSGMCAHVDTLGLMVRSISDNGTLGITALGEVIFPTYDGEYCRIYTRDGKVYTGTVLSKSPAWHVFEDANSRSRDAESMEVRIDEVVKSKEDVQKLGIAPGDFICIDPKTDITPSGFIKSRFLDDKLSASILLGFMKCLKDNNVVPDNDLMFLFSNYEEPGHGMAWLPEGMSELIAVDMGCIGDDLSCTEYDVSICAKDSGGPYDYDTVTRLVNLAKSNSINYAVDIFPKYMSDVCAAQRAGHDVTGVVIGPGVSASHGMERSHYDAVEATVKLLAAYFVS